jgi:hypothetical protein
MLVRDSRIHRGLQTRSVVPPDFVGLAEDLNAARNGPGVEVWQILRNRIACVEITRAAPRPTFGDHQTPASTIISYVTLAVVSPTRSDVPQSEIGR